MKQKKIDELSKAICNGCKTRHKCDNECCTMSYVVAEYLIEKGYGNIKKFATDLVYKSVFGYKGLTPDCVEQCEDLISQFEDTVRDFAKDYGVEIEDITPPNFL